MQIKTILNRLLAGCLKFMTLNQEPGNWSTENTTDNQAKGREGNANLHRTTKAIVTGKYRCPGYGVP
jgi:hypothetical protein